METIIKEKTRFSIKDGVILVLLHPNDEDKSSYVIDRIIKPSMDLELDENSSNDEILTAMYIKVGRKLLDEQASELIEKKNKLKNINIYKIATEIQKRFDERLVYFKEDSTPEIISPACLSKYVERLSDLWIYVGDFTEDERDAIKSLSRCFESEDETLIKDEIHEDYINASNYTYISDDMKLKLDIDCDGLDRIDAIYKISLSSVCDVLISENLTIMDFEKMSKVLSDMRISVEFVSFDTEDLDDLKYELSNPSYPVEENY